MRVLRVVTCLLALLTCGVGQQVAPHVHHSDGAPTSGQQPVTITGRIPDIELLNQRGEKVLFYSGLLRNKVVAINTIFTTCTTICPVMGDRTAKLEQRLGHSPYANINLISISVDPVTDTPQRLATFAKKYNGGPGWTLLTGSKGDVDRVLKALNVFVTDKQDHTPILLIGHPDSGRWTRTTSLGSLDKLVELIHSFSGGTKP
jgi:protein SCO1/2